MIIPLEDYLIAENKVASYSTNEIEDDKSINKKLNNIILNTIDDFSLNKKYLKYEQIENIPDDEFTRIMTQTKTNLEEGIPEEELYFYTKPGKVPLIIDGSTKTSTTKEIKEDNLNKAINFTTILRKKRGRKIENPIEINNKKSHSSLDFDNIQRKVQVHFISFLIDLANDALKTVFGTRTKFHFKDVEYTLKRIVKHDYIEYLKECKYSDIMQMKISSKFKNFKGDANKNTFLQVCKISDKMRDFFDKKYLYIFQNYYSIIGLDEKEVDFDGLKIKLSSKTKALSHLLSINEKNKKLFINAVKDVYFYDCNYVTAKKFISLFSP